MKRRLSIAAATLGILAFLLLNVAAVIHTLTIPDAPLADDLGRLGAFLLLDTGLFMVVASYPGLDKGDDND